MDFPKDRRVLIGAGAAVALLLVVSLAALFRGGGEAEPESGSRGNLVVEVGREDTKIDPNRQLPCYVNGQAIGMATHARCAERNGVSSGQLDVGIDQSGELAYGAAGAALAPLPPEDSRADAAGALTTPPPAQAAVSAPTGSPPSSQVSRGPVAACWRYADRDWMRLGDMPLEACATVLFDGRCERPGGATYGRWGEQTLRLVPGQIEQSPDNFNFHTLVRQGANCTVPGF